MSDENSYYDQYDEDKNTRLHHEAALDNIPLVQELLEGGEKVDPENFLGWTPLMMAARNGNFEMVKLLIEHKADATKKNLYGSNVFLMAVASGDVILIHFILQHILRGGVSKQSLEFVLSPLTVALLFQQDLLVNYLVAQSFNVNNITPITGITPIMISAMLNNESLFQFLISQGADPFSKNINDQSAYQIIVAMKHRPNKKSSSKRQNQQNQQHHQPHHQQHPQNQQQQNQQNHHNQCNQHSQCNHQHDHYLPYQQSQVQLYPHPQYPLLLSPQLQTPTSVMYLSPNFCSNQGSLGKFPNVPSSSYMVMPSLSPITPMTSMTGQQFFFPANFQSTPIMNMSNPFSFTTDVYGQSQYSPCQYEHFMPHMTE